MQRRSLRARMTFGTALVGMLAGTLAPAGAYAASPATGITVFLKAPHLKALHQLARARGLTHAQRVAALSKLLPSAADRRSAVQALQDAGLKVTRQTAWTISATASQATVDASFGAHPVMRAHATPAQRRAAAGPYPSLPSSLEDVATAAFPTRDGPAVFKPAVSGCGGCLAGADFRNAYTSPAMTALGQPPYSGLDPAATLTIATVQLAGWNPSDLTAWANTPAFGVPGFNLATDVTQVPVDQATVPAPSDSGDEEVDLDQEALLSTDPYAHQRPYFAPNTNAGYGDAFSQVLDDVLQDSHAYQGGDPRIAALSVSWGLCEADTGNPFIHAFEPIVSSLVAAGVTVFASSGDFGIYDGCSAATTNADYPASSPEVIGVGGTNLSSVGAAAANNGTNWTESAWTCTDASSCSSDGTGGSGGGASSTFGKPGYQSAITNPPFSTSSARLVPDISANGDPQSGFPVYTTDPTDAPAGSYVIIGGTSLAAPQSAALFTNVLAAHGATAGIGDIHGALYAAYAAHDGSFRDVTAGSNGLASDAPSDPSVHAAVGYDTVTGLGSPLWPALSSLLFAPTSPPNVAATLALSHPHSRSAPRAVRASWHGSASSGGAPLAHVNVTITRAGQTTPVYSNLTAPATGSVTITGAPGATYILDATSFDIAGKGSDKVVKKVAIPVDDRQFTLHGKWKRVNGGGDVGGSAIETSTRHATATAKGTGRIFSVVVETGPAFGELSISQGFSTIRTINLHSARAGRRTVKFFAGGGSPGTRTFRFTCLGKKKGHAKGTKVGIDAMNVVY
ncbi:MAG TPA: hypothetical protein VHB18_07895 [Mycobacteriales bacterium]|jgi:kumamolisin|nr:hypothetical protein [Mycobacteriales bacterium]